MNMHHNELQNYNNFNCHFESYYAGSYRSGTDLQDFKMVYPVAGRFDVIHTMKFDTKSVNGRLIYPMVLCLNGRGMSTTK